MWTGKGLVSWALNELGVGKNLITGRLVKSAAFSLHANHANANGMDPLEALMAAGADAKAEEEGWGIEVSLGLKQAAMHVPTPAAPAPAPTQVRPTVASSSSSPALTSGFHHAAHPAVPRRSFHAPGPVMPIPAIPSRVATATAGPSAPTSSRRAPNSTPARQPPATTSRSKAGSTTSRKKRAAPPSRHLNTVDTNANARASTSNPNAANDLPFEIPRHVYDNPELLTKEQAERLIASPLFLDRISQMTGHPLVPKMKRERDDDTLNGGLGSAKKPRFLRTDADGQSTSMCYNCGRVKSYVWRQLTLDDGNVVTICNGMSAQLLPACIRDCRADMTLACGLYKNRHGHMRPPSMWEGVDDEVKTLRLGGQTQTQAAAAASAAPSSDIDMPATRVDSASASAFKRTMSSVVNKDAKRIASLRKPNVPLPRPTPLSKPMPMTSPPRGSASATKTVPHAHAHPNGISAPPPLPMAASSPAVKTRHTVKTEPTQEDHDEFDPNESPGTAIRRILGTNMPLQSLDMPLSDDIEGGRGGASRQEQGDTVDWSSTDISTFFNLDSFEMPAGPDGHGHGARPPASHSHQPQPPPFARTHSTRMAYTHTGGGGGSSASTGEEDDVLSQLFNRTSSIGAFDGIGSSPRPMPFDFSQLPPSSPPVSASDLDLGHSVLLLSSPGSGSASASPNIPPPLAPHPHVRTSPEKDRKSSLKHSFTPEQYTWSDDASSGEVAEHMLGHTHSFHAQTQTQQQHQQQSIDADDFMAFFNGLTN